MTSDLEQTVINGVVNLWTTCKCPQMFRPSRSVYMEESSEPWVGTTLLSGTAYLALLWGVGPAHFLAKKDIAEGMPYLWKTFQMELNHYSNTVINIRICIL